MLHHPSASAFPLSIAMGLKEGLEPQKDPLTRLNN
jgi:hypothetical protein